jgi:carboxypeptidase Taq
MSSQLFHTAKQHPAVSTGLAEGNYAPLKSWLNENVHQYGRGSTPAETLLRVTGRPLDTAPYIADLTEKVATLTA